MSTISEQEYITRIRQLERLNAGLTAQVDRMRPVVNAARKVPVAGDLGKWCEWLSRVVVAYDVQMAQLAKESGDGR